MLSPLLEPGHAGGGDDHFHFVEEQELENIILQEHKIFGWSYLYGLGSPIFLFRPPLHYFIVVFTHLLTLNTLSLLFVHKLVIILLFSLYPLPIYYLLKKFDFPDLVCGMGALFSVAPISPMGHTLDAYFRFGVIKQMAALFIFPIFVGKLHGIIYKKENLFVLPFLMALMYLSHPYICYFSILILGIYLFTFIITQQFTDSIQAIKRSVIVLLVLILLLAFYLLPFLGSGEIQYYGFLSINTRTDFPHVVYTSEQFLTNLVHGHLFDSGKAVGIYDEYLPQFDNPYRPPIFTLFILLGFVVMLRDIKSFRNSFFVLAFLFSVLMALGPDDIWFLRYMPLQKDLDYHHYSAIMDLFAMCLSAFALYKLAEFISVKAFIFLKKSIKVSALVATLIICILVFVPIYADRLKFSEGLVRVKSFTVLGAEDAGYSSSSIDLSFRDCLNTLRMQKDNGRMYGIPVNDFESFYLTHVTILTNKTNVINGAFAGITGGLNRRLNDEGFRRKIAESYNIIEICNIRYLLLSKSYMSKISSESDPYNLSSNLTLLRDTQFFTLYKVNGDFGNFKFVESLPVLVFADDKSWWDLNSAWLLGYKLHSAPKKMPFFVRSKYLSRGDLVMNINMFSGMMVLNPESLDPLDLVLIKNYEKGGGFVMWGNISSITSAEKMNTLRSSIEYMDLESEAKEIVDEREHNIVTVKTNRPAFLIFKTAYYRSWVPTLDGKVVKNFEISPGLSSIIVPKGEHIVEFNYEGPNYILVGSAISALTVALLLVYAFTKKRKEFKNGI